MPKRCAPPFVSSTMSSLPVLILLFSSFTTVCAQQGNDKPQTVVGSRGDRNAREIKYSGWNKFCFKTPGSNMVCRTSINGTWETGQLAVRVDLIEREGDSNARVQLFLPVGLYLQTAAKLSVDQAKPYQVPYVWCLTNACIAGDKANPDLVKEMESGEKLKLEVVDTNLLSVSTVLPLDRFASIRRSAPTQIIQQDIDE